MLAPTLPPYPATENRFLAAHVHEKAPRRAFGGLTETERAAAVEAGRVAMAAKLAEWAAIEADPKTRLRQNWRDVHFMRRHLTAAGLRVPNSLEPATAPRLRQLLRRAGVVGAAEHVGVPLEQYLVINPRLPLWAAVALVLEAAGRHPVVVEGDEDAEEPGDGDVLALA